MKRIFSWFIVFPLWVVVVALAGGLAWRLGSRVSYLLGYQPVVVPIAGTGSMYPTFPKSEKETPQERSQEVVAEVPMRVFPGGLTWQDRRFFSYELNRGDIVNFYNQATESITQRDNGEIGGFVKRIIGMPGDVIEIRDGFVYRNQELLEEPYTAAPRSTFGGAFLADCHPFAVPAEKLFVMGDNRKSSNDSRHEVGLVDYKDVQLVLPWNQQANYQATWRDASQDSTHIAQPELDVQDYLRRLNAKRQAAGLKPLVWQPKLADSARRRAEVMLRYNDLSFEATRSGYTMAKAMKEVGYSATLWSEAPTLGYYTAEELVDNYAEFPAWQKILLNKEYTDTGISAFVGEINGCPTQIVVQHFGGYRPPNYQAETIQGWEEALKNLRQIRPGWANLKEYPDFYSKHKDSIDRLLVVIDLRIKGIEDIVTTMKANKWFSATQEAYLDQDIELAKQQKQYSEYLNQQEF